MQVCYSNAPRQSNAHKSPNKMAPTVLMLEKMIKMFWVEIKHASSGGSCAVQVSGSRVTPTSLKLTTLEIL